MKRKTKRLLIEFISVMIIMLILLIIILPKFLDAQSINTPKCIPDPVFRALLEDALGVQPGEVVSRRQAAQLTELQLDPNRYFYNQSQLLSKTAQGASSKILMEKLEQRFKEGFVIYDLTGIKYFKNLKQLNLSGNRIEHFNLPTMPSLKSLNCSRNPLKNLDISNNPQLEILLCAYNQLASLDVSNNRELRHLDCSDNKLKILDISQNPLIYELECKNNSLTSIAFASNSDLLRLDIFANQMKSINLANLSNLETLDIANNFFTRIPDISNLKKLKAINLEYNLLKQDTFPQIDQLIKRFSGPWIILNSKVSYGILYQNQEDGRFVDGVFVDAKPISEN
jgi:Leucine-rich repeat (LRR) protein